MTFEEAVLAAERKVREVRDIPGVVITFESHDEIRVSGSREAVNKALQVLSRTETFEEG